MEMKANLRRKGLKRRESRSGRSNLGHEYQLRYGDGRDWDHQGMSRMQVDVEAVEVAAELVLEDGAGSGGSSGMGLLLTERQERYLWSRIAGREECTATIDMT